MYKGSSLLLSSSRYSPLEVHAHFRQAAWFFVLSIAGSITGSIWPGVFKYCRYAPVAPSDDFLDAPGQVRQLAEVVEREQETAPLGRLKQFWSESSLEEKHWFVQVFNRDGSESFKTVRTGLAATVYQPIQNLRNRHVQWRSTQEVGQRPFFYHATSERSLESILKSRKVEVRHEKTFRGAFVSTQPETGFGRCILAFNRNVERLSALEHGFQMGTHTYWAGFSHGIPVTESTLAYIILEGENFIERQELEARCQQWTGRRIQVVSLRDAATRLRFVEQLDMGIPAEWPAGDNETGQKILNTLRARATVEDQLVVPNKVEKLRQPLLVQNF
jgi:hypothetical protein